MVSYLALSLYLGYYYEIGEPRKFQSVMCTGYIIKMALTSILLFMCFVLGWALAFNGANSYDQILIGYFFGISMAAFLHYNLKVHFKFLPVYLSKPKDYYLRRVLYSWKGYSGSDLNENHHHFFVSLPLLAGVIGAGVLLVGAVYVFWLIV